MSDNCNGKKCPCNSPCPIKKALEIIGGKWKTQIICSLKVDGTTRYGELSRKIDGITNTMLASSLKDLEKDGLIERIQYNTMPIKVEYKLTEKSEKLVPILQQLAMWAIDF